MPLLPIRQFPDPVLRADNESVSVFDGELESLVRDMIETMKEAPGVGLAAPQVGVNRRVAVVNPEPEDPESSTLILVNPELSALEGTELDVEGCLSIPDFTEKVPRATKLLVEAAGLDGAAFELEAEGFLARVIQHEVDHLDGILFTDRLKGLRKERGRRHLKRLKQAQRGN